MLTKISGLARTLYIVLAIVTGFVALGALNVALVLVVLGLIAGLSLPEERHGPGRGDGHRAADIGTALGNIPAIGAQLSAVTGNLQLGVAGAVASALAICFYQLVMDGVTGLTGGDTAAEPQPRPHARI